MKLSDFIELYDREESIVLLEGKRLVGPADREKLWALGKLLTEKTSKMKFRSGNAGGADQLFSEGVASVNPERLQVITPYAGHRSKTNKAAETIPLNEVNIAAEPEVVYQSKGNKKTEQLIDRYVTGEINHYTIKAAYILRDTIKVIGTRTIKPATFGIFYDDPENPKSGGTGHTMQVCAQNNIPAIDQSIWFSWLEEERESLHQNR